MLFSDIDECTSGSDSCTNGATCVNTDGSYSCTCIAGWTGDMCGTGKYAVL